MCDFDIIEGFLSSEFRGYNKSEGLFNIFSFQGVFS